ncbi:hypothetical protein [Aquimarina celericrescens]|uniref:Uncharacterized protein n=1 Tax=Aquimarina celericrescens TaxID=1964542 RepID=A0ABW5AY62_9FLAO|nr:hypothetical protein [Aquimarina celericrescens]
MKKKWYLGVLITALALLVVVQQQTVVPNQEIVLEFVTIEASSLEAQNAITTVKKQLQSIGVKGTRISNGPKNGTLKITYYSDAGIEVIKKILSEEHNVALEHTVYDHHKNDNKYPSDKNPKDYHLDVYEIQKSTDFGSDFNGIYISEVNQERGEYSNFYSFGVVPDNKVEDISRLIKVAQKVNTNIAIAIDNTSHNIPEVRAGPIA